jgi:hypothetical protein
MQQPAVVAQFLQTLWMDGPDLAGSRFVDAQDARPG